MGDDDLQSKCIDELKGSYGAFPSRELQCRTNQQHTARDRRCDCLEKCRIHASSSFRSIQGMSRFPVTADFDYWDPSGQADSAESDFRLSPTTPYATILPCSRL